MFCLRCCVVSCRCFCASRCFLCNPYTSVLPCCTADTPIEEFTPTPAFPALQYLESVDEGGVAWQAGLRTGDFLIEVRAAPFQILFSLFLHMKVGCDTWSSVVRQGMMRFCFCSNLKEKDFLTLGKHVGFLVLVSVFVVAFYLLARLVACW